MIFTSIIHLPSCTRDLRLEVTERVLHTGEVFIPLDEQSVRDQIKTLKKNRVDAVVICLLYSYLNPSHEARIKEMVREAMPDCYHFRLPRGLAGIPGIRAVEHHHPQCLSDAGDGHLPEELSERGQTDRGPCLAQDQPV